MENALILFLSVSLVCAGITGIWAMTKLKKANQTIVTQAVTIGRMQTTHHEQIAVLKSSLRADKITLAGLIGRGMKMELRDDSDPVLYQCVVVFSVEMVRQMLLHGDSRGIELMADAVSMNVARELRAINFLRIVRR